MKRDQAVDSTWDRDRAHIAEEWDARVALAAESVRVRT
jgi:hypothetical protein